MPVFPAGTVLRNVEGTAAGAKAALADSGEFTSWIKFLAHHAPADSWTRF